MTGWAHYIEAERLPAHAVDGQSSSRSRSGPEGCFERYKATSRLQRVSVTTFVRPLCFLEIGPYFGRGGTDDSPH